MQLLSQLQDRNLCRLKGYCAHESARNAAAASSELQLLSEKLSTTWRAERLLVFEQSPNGSLHDHLFGSGLIQQQQQSSKTELLDWTTRIKIALGAARGLLYIHDRAPLQVHKQISLLQAVKTNLLPPSLQQNSVQPTFCLQTISSSLSNKTLHKCTLVQNNPPPWLSSATDLCQHLYKTPKRFIRISDSSLAHSQSVNQST